MHDLLMWQQRLGEITMGELAKLGDKSAETIIDLYKYIVQERKHGKAQSRKS